MKPLKSCTGGSAEGDKRFFLRKKIVRKIRRKLANKENLLISAPRRIGKTSLLKHLRDTPEQNQIIIYLIVQSVASVEEFNKRLFDELMKNQQVYNGFDGFRKRANAEIKRYVTRLRSVSLEGGIEINDNENINYYAWLNTLLDELQQHEKQIILFIDEFPDVITNIDNEDKKANRNDAITLLQQQREIREKYKNSQIQFVYTGSTGLKNVVSKLGDIHLINNLPEVKVPPFSRQEATELMQRLILGKQKELEEFELPDEVVNYTLDKIQWLLPYYIQIIVEGLFEEFEDDESNPPAPITTQSVDNLFKTLVKSNSTHADYFEHWKIRLHELNHQDEELAIAALNLAAHQGTISYAEYKKLSAQHGVKDLRHVLNVLQYDGYLSGDEEENNFGFNSVLLKEWWRNNVAR